VLNKRLLWIGDGGCTTGFGRVTHNIADRLVDNHGWDVHVLAINYDGDYFPTSTKLYRPTKLVPNDIFGRSRYIELLAEILPDAVFILNDPYPILRWLFRNQYDPDLILARTRPLIGYMPIDGVNQPPRWAEIPDIVRQLEPLPSCPIPSFTSVAMTKWGQAQFNTPYAVPHGVNTDRYYPVSDKRPMTASDGTVIATKKDAKRYIQIDPDAFLVLRVDRNSHRKNFADTWRALVPVMRRHKDMVAWFHCKAEGDQLEMPQLIGRDPETFNQFRFPGQFSTKLGWPDEDLAVLYNAADLFVSTSWGEGFGLTLAEAAATGIPIVAQNVSAIPEVVGPGAILLEPERLIAVDSGQDQWLPNVGAFTDAIERLYLSAGARRDLGQAGRIHVTSSFSWDAAARQFDEIISRVIQENPAVPQGDVA